jgi:hypothetical protein
MAALIGLIAGMVLGIVFRELWSLWQRKEDHLERMEQTCLDWAGLTTLDDARWALLKVAQDYRDAIERIPPPPSRSQMIRSAAQYAIVALYFAVAIAGNVAFLWWG